MFQLHGDERAKSRAKDAGAKDVGAKDGGAKDGGAKDGGAKDGGTKDVGSGFEEEQRCKEIARATGK